MTDKYEQKRVTISSKRQFTIPQKFYSALGFQKEAVCTMAEGMLIIQPAVPSADDLSEEILADLIREGYSGEALLKEFKVRQAKIRPAVEKLLQTAKDAAQNDTEYVRYEDIFPREE